MSISINQSPYEQSSFYLNSPSLTQGQMNTHELFLKDALNALFRSIGEKQPTKILLWGSHRSGKTSFCTSLINTIAIHGNTLNITNPADLNRPLNFRCTSVHAPNTVMLEYPSQLCHIYDVNSNIASRKAVDLDKTINFLKDRNFSTDVVCLFLDINDVSDVQKLTDVLYCYRRMKQINKTAILILTKVDLYDNQLPDLSNRPSGLDKIITQLQEEFPIVVPLINYQEGTDLNSNVFTKRAIVEVLFHARFGKKLSLPPQVKGIEPLQLFAFVFTAIQLLKLRKG